MGATSVTGVGTPSADTQNKGSEYQTLGIAHIIDRLKWGTLYTEFPADGNWNNMPVLVGDMARLSSFYVGFQSFPFFNWRSLKVESALITEEKILAVVDPDGLIAGITFSDEQDATAAPFTYRVINVNTFFLNPVQPHVATIAWQWNDVVLYLLVQSVTE